MCFMNKYIISKDDKKYRAFPDLLLINDKLICIFAEMNDEKKEYNLCYSISEDRGQTWSETKIFAPKLDDNGRWDAPRICNIDNEILVYSSWYLNGDKSKKNSYIHIWRCDEELNIKSFEKTTITGIVPDKIVVIDDKWIMASQERNEKLDTTIFFSYDLGKTWSQKQILAHNDLYNLCETSIVKIDNKLVALMRENSDQGIDCLKTISDDNGKTWSEIYKMPIPACHRPVTTKLMSGKYLITYRFNQGKFIGKGIHGQNLFGCLCTKEDMLEPDRNNISTRIFPIDYDRNINSNCGYTGVVQFDDGMIYVASYIVDDNPVGQIRGYSFYESDIVIETK